MIIKIAIGHDCVPWDLLTLECVKLLKKRGEHLSSINFYDEIKSDPSGGTLETVFHSLGDRLQYDSKLGFDPLLKDLIGSKSETKTIMNTQSFLGYDNKYVKNFVGPFIMVWYG